MKIVTVKHQYMKKGKKLLFIALRQDQTLSPGYLIFIKTYYPDKDRKTDNEITYQNSGDILYNRCKYIDTIVFFESEGYSRISDTEVNSHDN